MLNGVEVKIEQYPYTAQVVKNNASLCGGAAISKRVIVTAAHCVTIDNEHVVPAKDFDVWFGKFTIKF